MSCNAHLARVEWSRCLLRHRRCLSVAEVLTGTRSAMSRRRRECTGHDMLWRAGWRASSVWSPGYGDHLLGIPCLTVVRRLGSGGRPWRLGEGPRGVAGHEYGPGADVGSRVAGTLRGPSCGPWSDM